MDEPDEPTPVTSDDGAIKELLGLHDVPAFARRGQNLEYALARLHERCRRERHAMLDMVRVRLRQWAGTVAGPDNWNAAFAAPVDALWPLSGADPPVWAEHPAPPRRQRAIAQDLVASITRFNRRWTRFLEEFKFEYVNRQIDEYNRYYLLEKECSLGSARLAARYFSPKPLVTREGLLAEYPFLPLPELVV